MKLLIFPKDSNPYQELLYGQLKDRVETAYIDVGQQSLLRFISFYPLLLGSLILYRLRGYKLLHLHWLYPFYVPKWVPLHRQLAYVQIRLFFVVLRALGYKVVWTVHNVVPQFSQTPNDEQLMQRLGRLAKAKIIHSTSALADLKQHGISTAGSQLIPHGNYQGVYPDAITQAEARRRLKLSQSDIVLLFFGHIAPYKGVNKLLDIADTLDVPNVRVVLAGECYNDELQTRIGDSVKRGRVMYHGGHIKDKVVAMYFKAADVVCLPFTAITTSGSVILSLTFGRPVIAPQLGAIKDIPHDAGYFYAPSDPTGLETAIKQAIANRQEATKRGRNAERYAKTLDWSVLAQKTYDVYQDVLMNGVSDNS